MTFPHMLSVEPLKLTVGVRYRRVLWLELETETYFLKIT